MSTDYEAMRPFASQRQLEVLDALAKGHTQGEAAKLLGVRRRSVERVLQSLKRAAARQGYAPEYDLTHPVPPGQVLRGASTYYDKDGVVRGQWVKSMADREKQAELLMEALRAIAEDFRGGSKRVPAPRKVAKDLLTVYPFGDPHIGLYSYAKETGANFDIEIAEQNLIAAVDRLVATTPVTETAILLSVGDFFHADTSDNRSLNSGHSFDVDTRWSRVLETGIRAMRRIVDRALEKHRRVVVRCMSGNHDYHTSQMLGLALAMYYENNNRVDVDTSPAYFWFHRFGKVLIGSTHGDTAKPELLPSIMADERPEDWGETVHRYWYTGHIHTRQSMEFRGCLWESFRTLAARDAWTAKMGYRAGRDMHAIVHHIEHGEIERHRVDVGMLPT